MIRFDHVYKLFGKQSFALTDVSVEITDGDFVFLIGPSGAGKTTLLKLMLRDILPTKGHVFIDDLKVDALPVNRVHLLRRSVGMVFQDFKLLTDRTVYENVAMSLEILGKKTAEVKKGVSDVLGLVNLSHKSALFPLQLSAGEMQRTSIARAIVGGPKILLADEPTGNLDPDSAWEILNILQEINSIGTTVIMATHNSTIVNEMKKRTITLHNGKIVNDEKKGKYSFNLKQKEHLNRIPDTGKEKDPDNKDRNK